MGPTLIGFLRLNQRKFSSAFHCRLLLNEHFSQGISPFPPLPRLILRDFPQKMASALSENPASVIHSLNLAHNTLDNQGSSSSPHCPSPVVAAAVFPPKALKQSLCYRSLLCRMTSLAVCVCVGVCGREVRQQFTVPLTSLGHVRRLTALRTARLLTATASAPVAMKLTNQRHIKSHDNDRMFLLHNFAHP